MLDLLWRVPFRWYLHPGRALGDTTYGTMATLRALEDAGIRAYVQRADWDHTAYYGPSRFRYDAERKSPIRRPLRVPQCRHAHSTSPASARVPD